jgi:hypothetical protein
MCFCNIQRRHEKGLSHEMNLAFDDMFGKF